MPWLNHGCVVKQAGGRDLKLDPSFHLLLAMLNILLQVGFSMIVVDWGGGTVVRLCYLRLCSNR